MRKVFLVFAIMLSVTTYGSAKNEPSLREVKVLFDCGPQCVRYLSRYFSRPVTLEKAYELCEYDPDENVKTSLLQTKHAVQAIGLHAYGFMGKLKHLRDQSFEGSAFITCALAAGNKKAEHFVVIAKAKKSDTWLWIDPAQATVEALKPRFFDKTVVLPFLAVSDSPLLVGQQEKADHGISRLLWITIPSILACGSVLLLKFHHSLKVKTVEASNVG